MTELQAEGWYNITGRGWVAACRARPEEINHPDEYVNRYVNIDGKEYYVTGCETFAVGLGGKGKYPHALGFGLIIRGEK
jgi:hypothetical protein